MGKRSFKKSFNVQDEYQTPSILVNMLIPYLEKYELVFATKHNRKPIIGCRLILRKASITQFLKKTDLK